ncbi:hypothetical protein CC2G_014388 [Coprinopsis cinerea AmutBmut pab1-1]|nr:hypothetical protein CC2G_014388 [Coprinopsis cinerea AmutBmut pab1-1]
MKTFTIRRLTHQRCDLIFLRRRLASLLIAGTLSWKAWIGCQHYVRRTTTTVIDSGPTLTNMSIHALLPDKRRREFDVLDSHVGIAVSRPRLHLRLVYDIARYT